MIRWVKDRIFSAFEDLKKKKNINQHQHQLPSQELCQRICGEHCWRPKLGLSRWDSEARTTFGWHSDAMSAKSAMRHMEKKTCPVRWKIVGIQIRSNHFNWGLSLWRNFWYMFTWNTSWYLICHESWCLKMFDLNWTEAQAVPSPRPGARTLPRSGRTHGRKSLGANPTHPTWKVVDWTKLSFNVHKTHRKNGKMI